MVDDGGSYLRIFLIRDSGLRSNDAPLSPPASLNAEVPSGPHRLIRAAAPKNFFSFGWIKVDSNVDVCDAFAVN